MGMFSTGSDMLVWKQGLCRRCLKIMHVLFWTVKVAALIIHLYYPFVSAISYAELLQYS